MSDPQRLVVFVHIPKAAGTTLVSIIEQEYRPRSIYRFRHAHTIEEQVGEINRAANPLDREWAVFLLDLPVSPRPHDRGAGRGDQSRGGRPQRIRDRHGAHRLWSP